MSLPSNNYIPSFSGGGLGLGPGPGPGPSSGSFPTNPNQSQEAHRPSPRLSRSNTNVSTFASTFSTKRVWVTKANRTPTSICVHQSDLIDDLKQAIVNKFPHTLGAVYDPADLLIKLDLSPRNPQQSQSQSQLNLAGKKKQSNLASWSFTADNAKSPSSPISTSVPTGSGSTYTQINLEPDQNVWSILDHYYPGGMSMQDAFIIDHHNILYDDGPVAAQPRQDSTASNLSNSLAVNRHGPQPISIPPKSTTPVHQSYFHQPQPQYLYQSALANHNAELAKDMSISPEMINTRTSPVPIPTNHHRRSYSNPTRSPVPDLPPNATTNANNAGTNTNGSSTDNSQVVLLLPKNFSLTAGGNTTNLRGLTTNNKKRLSLDENLISNASPTFKSPASSSTNLTNIGVGINSPGADAHPIPFPVSVKNSLNSNLPALDVSRMSPHEPVSGVSSGVSEADSTRSNAGDSHNGSVTSGPRSSTKRTDSRTLNSPTRDSPTNNGPLESVDSVLTPEDEKSPIDKKKVVKDLQTKSNSQQSHNHGHNQTKSVNPKSNTEKVLPSISVLVVEDNAINQAILGAFLRKHRIHYQIAKNGQEAIDKWRTGGFHLVLMDIQLPVKSGIEATKEIRHLEKVNRIGVFAQHELTNSHYKNQTVLKPEEKLDLNTFRSPVIIVALTASSNSSVDKKNALMAGCNDYLTKPVNLVWLQNKITEWGCMQALIDFDGWKIKRNFKDTSNDTKTSNKKITHKGESKGNILLSNTKLLKG